VGRVHGAPPIPADTAGLLDVIVRYSGSGAPVVADAKGHKGYVVGSKPPDHFALGVGLVALPPS
jgi:hypothetical protein